MGRFALQVGIGIDGNEAKWEAGLPVGLLRLEAEAQCGACGLEQRMDRRVAAAAARLTLPVGLDAAMPRAALVLRCSTRVVRCMIA